MKPYRRDKYGDGGGGHKKTNNTAYNAHGIDSWKVIPASKKGYSIPTLIVEPSAGVYIIDFIKASQKLMSQIGCKVAYSIYNDTTFTVAAYEKADQAYGRWAKRRAKGY